MSKNLEYISDDRLTKMLNSMRAMIRRTKAQNGDTRDAEIELCYLEREQEWRDRRKNAHKEYMKQFEKVSKVDANEEAEALKNYIGE